MDPLESELRSLVERIARRDQEAMRELVERLGGRLLGALRRMVKDPAAAEDLLQDCLVSVWTRASTYRPARGDVAGWIYAIARNAARDHQRRLGRRPAGHRADEPPEDLGRIEAPADPASSVGVRRLLGELRDEERVALELTYFGGYSQSEAADRLRVPLGTLKSRVRFGLLRLRERMQE